MGFLVYCDNKSCKKEMEPVLDKNTKEVFCTECGKTINSVTEFAKNQMVSLGQVKRSDKKQQAFSVKCEACQKESPPKLVKDGSNTKLVCPMCEVELTNLSAPYANMVKQVLGAQRKLA